MSSVLDLYVEEITGNLAKLDAQIALGKDCNEKTCKQLFKGIQDATKQAGVELRLVDKGFGYKEKFEALKNSVSAKQAEVNRALLMEGNSGNSVFPQMGKSKEDRARTEAINSKVERQNDTIERLHGIVNETEEVGVEILNELGDNREKIASAREKAQEINTDLSDAETRMKRMQRREDAGGCLVV
jgi:hypothetical protein